MKRSLYQCFNAKVSGSKIYCEKGRDFGRLGGVRGLAGGAPLELTVCQDCPDYDEMGPPLDEADRGWVRLNKRRR